MNGAVMKNFITPDIAVRQRVVGDGDVFVSEVDESDGSIALFQSEHRGASTTSRSITRSMDELRALFRDFVAQGATSRCSISTTRRPRRWRPTCSRTGGDLQPRSTAARDLLRARPQAVAGRHRLRGDRARDRRDGHGAPAGAGRAQRLQRAGGAWRGARLRRVAAGGGRGARAASAASSGGSSVVGTANGVTVIDDFAHNPDKIAATLATLHAFPGRLLVMFQPHGFGPLTLMKDEFIACFAERPARRRRAGDAGAGLFRRHGRPQRRPAATSCAASQRARPRGASPSPTAPACGDKLVELARPGDRIVIMGARDDTLSEFARELLARLRAPTPQNDKL